MRYPVPHQRQDLVLVADAAGDDQAAVFQFLVDDLQRQQFAALEVVGGLGGDAEQDFGFFLAEPDVVVFVDLPVDIGAGFEVRIAHVQLADAAQREGFERAGFGGGEVPDALAVDEAIGFQLAALVGVAERAAAMGADGLVELAEGLVVRLERLVVMTAHEEAALAQGVEQGDEEACAALREQILHADEPGEIFQVAGAELAAVFGHKAVAAAGVALDDAAQTIQVAIDGALADAVLGGEVIEHQRFALVELEQYAGQPVGQGVVVGAGHGVPAAQT